MNHIVGKIAALLFIGMLGCAAEVTTEPEVEEIGQIQAAATSDCNAKCASQPPLNRPACVRKCEMDAM